jgi:hypothetical protein
MNSEVKTLSNWNNYPIVCTSYQSPYFLEDISESMTQATGNYSPWKWQMLW